MNEKQIDRLKLLRAEYEFSNTVCDPVSFAQKQKNLLHRIAEFLIEPLEEYEENLKIKQESAIQENHSNG